MLGLHSAWPAAAIVAVSVGLSACSVPDWANPVEWYRDATGVSEDDPKPDARNTQNFEKGGEQPYPNLASVPPPPNNALSSADREKLRNSLAADRANAKYVESNDQYVAAPPKVVPSPPLNAPEPAAQPETPGAPAASVPATPAAPPQTPGTLAASVPATPAAQPQTATAPAPSVQATPVPAPAPATPPAASPAPVRGSEKPPQESSLTPPSVRSVPQGETPRPAPPPPPGVPVSAQTPSPPAPQPPPQTAALPAPHLRPPPGAAIEPVTAGGGAALPSGAGATLGTVTFTGNSAKLSPEVLAQVREVAALRERSGGGTIRVTGYSVPQIEQGSIAPRLASFNLALDRARAVAAALTQNGVPLKSVEIGASPPPPGQPGGVVEMSLEQ